MKTKKDKRKQPRWWQHFKAWIGGYFWIPCPICKEYFGGNDEPWGTLYTSYNGYNGGEFPSRFGKKVCANCEAEAEKINQNH